MRPKLRVRVTLAETFGAENGRMSEYEWRRRVRFPKEILR